MWAERKRTRDLDRVSSIRRNLLQSSAWPRSLAIGMLTAGLAAPAGVAISIMTADSALAACTATGAGTIFTCTGAAPNPAVGPFTYTATGPFNFDMMGNPNAAAITASGTAAVTLNAATFGGSINLYPGSSIVTTGGTGHGIQVNTSAGNVGTINALFQGAVIPGPSGGDALRYAGQTGSTFNVTVDSTGQLGGGTGDDGIVVTQAGAFHLTNHGLVSGGTGSTNAEGVLVSVGGAAPTAGSRIAGTVTIDNYKDIIGQGSDAVYDGGQAIAIASTGAVVINNYATGSITGDSQGVLINTAGNVTIRNDGSIVGENSEGVLITAANDVNVTNTSMASLIGATDGFVVNNANSVVYNNQDAPQLGLTEGLNGAGLLITNVSTTVAISNQGGGIFRGTNDGIRASSVGGTVSIDNSFGGNILGIIGGNSDGIDLAQIGGATINNNFGGEITGNANGIVIANSTADVTVQNNFSNSAFGGGITGVNGDGINMNNVTGNVLINNNFFSNIRGGSAGGGALGDGIDVTGVTGNITVNNFLGSITGNQRGVVAASTNGDVVVNSFFGSVTANNNDGITASTGKLAGLVDVDVGLLTANNGHGVVATATNGATTINVDVWGALNAGFNSFEDGIRAEGSATSTVNITNRFGATTNGGDDGIVVLQAGQVNITNQAGGTIASGVNNNLAGTNASEAIVVAVGATPGSGAGTGRIAGGVLIDNWGTIVSNDVFGGVNTINGEAINTSSTGSVAINNYTGGSILGSTNGAGTGAIEVDTAGMFTLSNSGLVAGTGTALSNGAVIDIHAATGSVVTNNAGGVIRSADSDPSKLILRTNFASAFGAATTINNDGTMIGNIDLIGAFNDTFHNTSATTWTFTGISDFGDGDTDTLNNTGQIRPIGMATINGLEFFNNGAPGFGNNGYINQRDGVLGDVFTVNPTDGETLVFFGAPGDNWLLQDVDLGTFAQSDADKFKINGDVNPAGSTGIVVDDHNNFAGAYNPNGITVVDVTGTTGLGDFFLEDGPITKGLWTYDLFLNPGNVSGPEAPGASKNCDNGDNCWVIASYLDNYSIPQTMGIVQGMWHTLADSWIERASDLRTVYGSTGGAGADLTYEAPAVAVPAHHSGNSGIWGRVIGQAANRDVSYTTEPFPDQFVTVDGGYNEHLGAIQGGIDHAFGHGNGTTVIGLLAGYAHNNVDFVDAGDTAKITAPHIGAYVNWLNGGTYIDALVKADFLNVDFDVAGEEVSTKGHSLGARIEAGHRHQMGHAFIEPVASIAYVHTQLDPVTIGGTDVSFDDGKSLRGRVGGRLGFTSVNESGQFDPYVHAYVGSEFLGENTVFFDSGPGLTVVDDVSGIFGEVGGGFNFTGTDRRTALYGQANYIFSDGYHAGNAKVGARVNW